MGAVARARGRPRAITSLSLKHAGGAGTAGGGAGGAEGPFAKPQPRPPVNSRLEPSVGRRGGAWRPRSSSCRAWPHPAASTQWGPVWALQEAPSPGWMAHLRAPAVGEGRDHSVFLQCPAICPPGPPGPPGMPGFKVRGGSRATPTRARLRARPPCGPRWGAETGSSHPAGVLAPSASPVNFADSLSAGPSPLPGPSHWACSPPGW